MGYQTQLLPLVHTVLLGFQVRMNATKLLTIDYQSLHLFTSLFRLLSKHLLKDVSFDQIRDLLDLL